MLVLARQRNESIIIGDNIEIVVLDIVCGNKVRLGISAPRDVTVHREEVYRAIQADQEAPRRAGEGVDGARP